MSTPSHNLLNRYFAYLFDHRYFLTFCIGVSILVFGIEIFNISLSIDEETPSIVDGPMKYWIRIDRWGLYLINALFQWGPPLPFFHLLIAIFANVIAFVWCLELWGWEKGMVKYLAAVFALTYPMIAFIYEYNQLQYGNYIGLIISVASVRIFLSDRSLILRLFGTILLLICALSIYQTLLFVAPVVLLIALSASEIESKEKFQIKPILNQVLLFIACMAIAVLLHELISRPIRSLAGYSGRYHTVAEFYTWHFISDYNPTFVIREIGALLLGQRWYVGYLTGIILLVCAGILLQFIITRPWEAKKKVTIVLLLILATLSPFLLVIATANHWPARSFLSLPILLAGIVYLAGKVASLSFRLILSMLIAVCFIYYWATTTRLFYANHIIWQRDKLLMNRIISRIEIEYGNLLSNKPIPIVFIGTPDRPNNSLFSATETAGGSILEWDNGSPHRIQAMMTILGVYYFRTPNAGERKEAQKMAENMHSWPAKTSLQSDGKIIVVKFGKVSEN